MERATSTLDIKDYTVTQTTLEQVFLSLVRFQRADASDNPGLGGNESSAWCCVTIIPSYLNNVFLMRSFFYSLKCNIWLFCHSKIIWRSRWKSVKTADSIFTVAPCVFIAEKRHIVCDVDFCLRNCALHFVALEGQAPSWVKNSLCETHCRVRIGGRIPLQIRIYSSELNVR